MPAGTTSGDEALGHVAGTQECDDVRAVKVSVVASLAFELRSQRGRVIAQSGAFRMRSEYAMIWISPVLLTDRGCLEAHFPTIEGQATLRSRTGVLHVGEDRVGVEVVKPSLERFGDLAASRGAVPYCSMSTDTKKAGVRANVVLTSLC
jgi:hypothetical protein